MTDEYPTDIHYCHHCHCPYILLSARRKLELQEESKGSREKRRKKGVKDLEEHEN